MISRHVGSHSVRRRTSTAQSNQWKLWAARADVNGPVSATSSTLPTSQVTLAAAPPGRLRARAIMRSD